MPWQNLDLDLEVPYLSILDENGEADDELVPEIADELLVKGFATMLKARRFDERRLKLQRSGEIGTFAPVNGQEAAQVGSVSVLRQDDWFVPSYRETAANFWRGADPADMLVFDAGWNEGVEIPDDSHDLPNAVPVGTQMLQAVGIAHAARLQGRDEIAMTYFGDGATSQGDFHEALNFAGVFGCPVVFLCQNNQYAISVPRERQTKSETLAQKALAYGLKGVQVDGNDLFAVYVAASEAARRAREDGAATMIECVTYRLEMHTTADDPTRYREDEEVETWAERGPLKRLETWMRGRDLLDDEKIKQMEEKIAEEIDDAWDRAAARIETLAPVAPMFEHLYAEPTPELMRQRRLLTGDGGEDGEEDGEDDGGGGSPGEDEDG